MQTAATGDAVLDRLTRVFRENFDDPALVVGDTLSRATMDRWDSFEQVKLVIAVEEEFGVKFTMEEVTSIASVAEFRKALAARLA